jgi:hypothetical protein
MAFIPILFEYELSARKLAAAVLASVVAGRLATGSLQAPLLITATTLV